MIVIMPETLSKIRDMFEIRLNLINRLIEAGGTYLTRTGVDFYDMNYELLSSPEIQ